MQITARVENALDHNNVTVAANGRTSDIPIPAKSAGGGSAVSGGELLFAAIATCYVNDIYREAARRGITIEGVMVEVVGEFPAEGEPATGISYRVSIDSPATDDEVRNLVRHTDTVAEIHNTIRTATPVRLASANGRPL